MKKFSRFVLFVVLSLGTLGWIFSVHGLIKLLNQLTTPTNRVKGELSATRLRQGAAEMLRRRFSHLQCEIKRDAAEQSRPLKWERRVLNCLLSLC